MKIAISTDTSCTISKELADKLDIKVFPLNVIINGEEYLDGVSINQDELLKHMLANEEIKTSTPPPQMVIDYFNKLFEEGYDKIIHFTISSKLSSMNQLFNFIAKDSFDNKIIVIDAYSVSSLMLSHVLYAYESVKNGISIEEIVDGIEKRKNDNAVVFLPENLTALKNGGRISPAIAMLGNMIGLKPVLTLQDGKLEKDSMARNSKKVMSERLQNLLTKYSKEQYDICIVSFNGNNQLTDSLLNQIKESIPNYNIPILPIAINVCAHCGPGTIGIVVSPKILNNSIQDYLI